MNCMCNEFSVRYPQMRYALFEMLCLKASMLSFTTKFLQHFMESRKELDKMWSKWEKSRADLRSTPYYHFHSNKTRTYRAAALPRAFKILALFFSANVFIRYRPPSSLACLKNSGITHRNTYLKKKKSKFIIVQEITWTKTWYYIYLYIKTLLNLLIFSSRRRKTKLKWSIQFLC